VTISCPPLSRVMRHGFITSSQKRKGNPWSGITRPLLGRKSLRQFPQPVRSWRQSFGTVGVILIDVLPRGQMINSDVYVQTLKRRFRRVSPHKNVTKALLHHNARPHASPHTQEAITKLQWTVLPHPPYSPDLAPSDLHLFSPLKDAFAEGSLRTTRKSFRK
jgi:hypothetical protein